MAVTIGGMSAGGDLETGDIGDHTIHTTITKTNIQQSLPDEVLEKLEAIITHAFDVKEGVEENESFVDTLIGESLELAPGMAGGMLKYLYHKLIG